jgi:membrane protease YdiL (CAAX protease family)
MLRDSGMRESAVAVVSSAIFALLHSSNLLSGKALLTVAVTLVYTFAFGILMYLTLRVTANLVWPIILHGLHRSHTRSRDRRNRRRWRDAERLLGSRRAGELCDDRVALIALIFIRGRVSAAGGGRADGLAARTLTD